MHDDGRARRRKIFPLPFALVALAAFIGTPAFAQQDAPGDVWVNECKKDGVLLDQAASLKREGKFDEAVERCLLVLSSNDNCVAPSLTTSPLIPLQIWPSCKSVARRQMARMPDAALAAYAVKRQAQMQDLFAKAGHSGSVEALHGIAARFPQTMHAANAARLAGDLAAERGEFDLAADLFKTAAESSVPFSQVWMRCNVKGALCLARAGNTRKINEMLRAIEAVSASRGDCGIVLFPAFAFLRLARSAMAVPVEFVPGTKTSYVSAIRAAAHMAELRKEALMRDEASRGFCADACLEEKPAWKIILSSLFGSPDGYVSTGSGARGSAVVPVVKCVGELVPGARPFLVDEDLYVTDGEKAFKVHVESGACSGLGAIRRDSGDGQGTYGMFHIPEAGAEADGTIIFMMRGRGWAGDLARNSLAAFRLTSEKKIEPLWDTERLAEKATGDFLDKASFASAPVFRGRNLFAAALTFEGDVQWHLCRLGGTTGAIAFNTMIGGFRISAEQSIKYVNAPSAPAVSGENAFVCTNGGVAACVSIIDGETKWAADYSQAAPLAGQGVFFNLEGPTGWADNSPVVVGDCVLFAPADSDILLALRRDDGALVDTVKRTTGNYRFIVSGPGETAVLAGSSLLPLAWENGRLAKGAKCELQEEICGRPFALADGLIVPTRKALYHVRYSGGRWGQPRILANLTDRDDPPLEVLPAAGLLIVVTKSKLTAFRVADAK
jgi:outer membrane protein assembly factor BamB